MARKEKTLSPTAAKKHRSNSSKAGLTFPVSRIARTLKAGKYVGATASAFLAGVLEYLAVEVLEIPGNVVRDNKKTRIVPRDIQMVIRNDEELTSCLEMLRSLYVPLSYNYHNKIT